MPIELREYVTYADAARRLGVTRSAVWNLVHAGRMATITVHGRRYVPLEAVDKRMRERGIRVPRRRRVAARQKGR